MGKGCVSRVSVLRIESVPGGLRIECDLSEAPRAEWRRSFDYYQRVAPFFFNSIRVIGSSIIAEYGQPDFTMDRLIEAIDKRIESANLKTNT